MTQAIPVWGISAKKTKGDRIVELKVHVLDTEHKPKDNGKRESRAAVAFWVKLHDDCCWTIMKDRKGEWTLGEKIHVYSRDGEDYLRTDHNEDPSDNLGSLPEM